MVDRSIAGARPNAIRAVIMIHHGTEIRWLLSNKYTPLGALAHVLALELPQLSM